MSQGCWEKLGILLRITKEGRGVSWDLGAGEVGYSKAAAQEGHTVWKTVTIRPSDQISQVGSSLLDCHGMSSLSSDLRSTKTVFVQIQLWVVSDFCSPSVTDDQMNSIIIHVLVSLSYHLQIIHFYPDACPVLLGRSLN